MKFATQAVHAGMVPDQVVGAITPPIYQTVTYVQKNIGENKGFDYTRATNPTRNALEENLATLECGEYGVSFASGMAAVDSVMRLLSNGEHIIASIDMYGGVSRLFDQILSRYGLSFSYVDTSNPEKIVQAIRTNTKMIWIETPSNPLLKITDIEAVSKISKTNNILLSVDSTLATPYILQPLKWGVDLVIHSTTKYLSGHNHLVGGAVITNDKSLYQQLKYIQKSVGAVSSPFDCWLTLIGVKTLPLRMERHSSNGMAIAQFLECHPKIKRVFYPGLTGHPQHSLAKSQMRDFGGVLSFEINGDFKSAVVFMNNISLCCLAESLGSVETMITHPASMTQSEMSKDERMKIGLTDSLIRLSVGIEDVEDIIEDLRVALEQV